MKFLMTMLLAPLLVASPGARAAEPARAEVRVVVMDVVKSKLIALDPRPNMAGAANHWRVTMKNMRIVSGPDPALRGRIVADVYLDDTYVWTKQGRIGLVVSYSTREDFKVIGWTYIQEKICIPTEYIPAGEEGRYGPDPGRSDWGCTPLPL